MNVFNFDDQFSQNPKSEGLVVQFCHACDSNTPFHSSESEMLAVINALFLLNSQSSSDNIFEPYLVKAFDSAICQYPENTEFAAKKLDFIFSNHQFRDAIEFFENMVLVFPTDTNLLITMAENVYNYQINEYDAETLALKADALYRNSRSCSLLAKIALDNNNPLFAYRIFKENLYTLLSSEDVFRMVLYRKGRIENSLKDDLCDFIAVFNNDGFFCKPECYSDSDEVFLQLLSENFPFEVSSFVALGGIYKCRKNFKSALEHFQTARSLNPLPIIFSALANTYYSAGNFAQTIEYAKFLNQNFQNISANVLLASSFRKLRKLEDAYYYFSRLDEYEQNSYMFVDELIAMFVEYGCAEQVPYFFDKFCDKYHIGNQKVVELLDSLMLADSPESFKSICLSWRKMFSNDDLFYCQWLIQACIKLNCQNEYVPFACLEACADNCSDIESNYAINYFLAIFHLLNNDPVSSETVLNNAISLYEDGLKPYFLDFFADNNEFLTRFPNIFNLLFEHSINNS